MTTVNRIPHTNSHLRFQTVFAATACQRAGSTEAPSQDLNPAGRYRVMVNCICMDSPANPVAEFSALQQLLETLPSVTSNRHLKASRLGTSGLSLQSR